MFNCQTFLESQLPGNVISMALGPKESLSGPVAQAQ